MPLHDTHYKHWDGEHRGIWYRRGVIAANGFKGCLRGKWMRQLTVVCWSMGFAAATVLFLVGQLLIADSVVVQWIGNLNPFLQTVARGLTTWLEQHPEISVRTTQNLIFYFFASNLAFLNLVAVALVIPYLVTRDLSSNAIIIYSSKAIGRVDYLLGKFATVFGVLALTWLAPISIAWFFGNLLAPNWGFFWHSRIALFHTLAYVVTCMLIVSLLALAISSISGKERTTVSIWIILWLVGNAFVPIASETKPWLKHLSFKFNLDQIALAIFRLGDDIRLAQDNIPLLGNELRKIKPETYAAWDYPAITGAAIALSVMIIAAIVIIVKKVKPE
jgi:hypothetical protein